MNANLRRAAGSLLIVGIAGTELTPLERAWLRLVGPSGIILFKRNIVDAAQTRALLADATALTAPHTGRFVDIEGGTVNRLREPLAPIPSVEAVAAAMRAQAKPALAETHGELIAQAARAFGFNATFAPCVDLALPESVPILGSRTASAHPSEVIDYARGLLKGLAAHRVAGCGKHFPGLGGADGDTHFVTPSLNRTTRQMEADLAPYRALHAAMPFIMTNHAAYPATPGRELPASASRYWIAKVLRERIGYRGLVVSDDLEMGGILKFMPIEQATVAAFRAGTDLFLICHSPEIVLRAYETLIAVAERSAGFRTELLARAAAAARKRAKLFAGPQARALTAKQLEALRQRIARFTEKIHAADQAPRAANPAEAA